MWRRQPAEPQATSHGAAHLLGDLLGLSGVERKERAHVRVAGRERVVRIVEPVECAPPRVDLDRTATPHGLLEAEERLVRILEVQVHDLRKQLRLARAAPAEDHSRQRAGRQRVGARGGDELEQLFDSAQLRRQDSVRAVADLH